MNTMNTMNTISTTMIDTPCPGFGRRFVVEASNSDPNTSHERGNLADCEIHATRTATNQRARFFLQRDIGSRSTTTTPRNCWLGLSSRTTPHPHTSSEKTKTTTPRAHDHGALP